jgi:hypothetical protein
MSSLTTRPLLGGREPSTDPRGTGGPTNFRLPLPLVPSLSLQFPLVIRRVETMIVECPAVSLIPLPLSMSVWDPGPNPPTLLMVSGVYLDHMCIGGSFKTEMEISLGF